MPPTPHLLQSFHQYKYFKQCFFNIISSAKPTVHMIWIPSEKIIFPMWPMFHTLNCPPSLHINPSFHHAVYLMDVTGAGRADSRFTPSQWETSLQSNAVSHWLGANLVSALGGCSDHQWLNLVIHCHLIPKPSHMNWLKSMYKDIWVESWGCGCLVTWFCYQLIAKPGNKTAAPPWLWDTLLIATPHLTWDSNEILGEWF